MRRDSINGNDGLWEAGPKAQEILSPSDATAFLKSLVEDFNPRCRTSDDFKRLALEYLDRWKSAVDYFAELEYLFDDFVQIQRCREEYCDKAMSRPPFSSATEQRAWTKRFIENFVREHSQQPATIAQQYLRKQQDWFDKPRQLTTEEVLGLLDASPLVEPWKFNTEEHGDVTFTDLSSLKSV